MRKDSAVNAFHATEIEVEISPNGVGTPNININEIFHTYSNKALIADWNTDSTASAANLEHISLPIIANKGDTIDNISVQSLKSIGIDSKIDGGSSSSTALINYIVFDENGSSLELPWWPANWDILIPTNGQPIFISSNQWDTRSDIDLGEIPVPAESILLNPSNTLTITPNNLESDDQIGQITISKNGDRYFATWEPLSNYQAPEYGTIINEEYSIDLTNLGDINEVYGRNEYTISLQFIGMPGGLDPLYVENSLQQAQYNRKSYFSGIDESSSKYGPSTPMILDIEALHSLYGPEINAFEADDHYSWDIQEASAGKTIYDTDGIDHIDTSNLYSGAKIDLRGGPEYPSSLGSIDTIQTGQLGRDSGSKYPLAWKVYDGRAFNLGQDGVLNPAGQFLENLLPGSTSNDDNLFIYNLNYESVLSQLRAREESFGDDFSGRYQISDEDRNLTEQAPNDILNKYSLELKLSSQIPTDEDGKKINAYSQLVDYLTSPISIELASGTMMSDDILTHGPTWQISQRLAEQNEIPLFRDSYINSGDGDDKLTLRGIFDFAIGSFGDDALKIEPNDPKLITDYLKQVDTTQSRVGNLLIGGPGVDKYHIDDIGSSYHAILLEAPNQININPSEHSKDRFISQHLGGIDVQLDRYKLDDLRNIFIEIILASESPTVALLSNAIETYFRSIPGEVGPMPTLVQTLYNDDIANAKDLHDIAVKHKTNNIQSLIGKYASLESQAEREDYFEQNNSLHTALINDWIASKYGDSNAPISADRADDTDYNYYTFNIRTKTPLKQFETNDLNESTMFGDLYHGYQTLFMSGYGNDTLEVNDYEPEGPGLFINSPSGIIRYTKPLNSHKVDKAFIRTTNKRNGRYKYTYFDPNLVQPLQPENPSLYTRQGITSFENLIFIGAKTDHEVNDGNTLADLVVSSPFINNVDLGSGDDLFIDSRFAPLGFKLEANSQLQDQYKAQKYTSKFDQVDYFHYFADLIPDTRQSISNSISIIPDIMDVDLDISLKELDDFEHIINLDGSSGDKDLLVLDLRRTGIDLNQDQINGNLELKLDFTNSERQLTIPVVISTPGDELKSSISGFEWPLYLGGTKSNDIIIADLDFVTTSLWDIALVEEFSTDEAEQYEYKLTNDFIDNILEDQIGARSELMSSGLLELGQGADYVDFGNPEWNSETFQSLLLKFGYGNYKKPTLGYNGERPVLDHGLPIKIDFGNNISQLYELETNGTLFVDKQDYVDQREVYPDTFKIDLSSSRVPFKINENALSALEYHDDDKYHPSVMSLIESSFSNLNAQEEEKISNQEGVLQRQITTDLGSFSLGFKGLISASSWDTVNLGKISTAYLSFSQLAQSAGVELGDVRDHLTSTTSSDIFDQLGLSRHGSGSRSKRDNSKALDANLIEFQTHDIVSVQRHLFDPKRIYQESGGGLFHRWSTLEQIDFIGSKANDYLKGGIGNDYINGHLGHDEIYGGKGDDVINGGQGSNYIYGGVGYDCVELSGNISDYEIYYNQPHPSSIPGTEGLIFYNDEANNTEFTLARGFECVKFKGSDREFKLTDNEFIALIKGNAVPEKVSRGSGNVLFNPPQLLPQFAEVPAPEYELPTWGPFPPCDIGFSYGLDISSIDQLVQDFQSNKSSKPAIYNEFLNLSDYESSTVSIDFNRKYLIDSLKGEASFENTWGVVDLSGTKTYNIKGDSKSNAFLINGSNHVINSLGGDDAIMVPSTSDSTYRLGSGSDFFTSSSFKNSLISTAKGNDFISLLDSSGTVNSGSGDDLVLIGINTGKGSQKSSSRREAEQRNQVLLGNGNDTAFIDISNVVVNAGPGDDIITFSSNSTLKGKGGDDIFAVQIMKNTEKFIANISGGPGKNDELKIVSDSISNVKSFSFDRKKKKGSIAFHNDTKLHFDSTELISINESTFGVSKFKNYLKSSKEIDDIVMKSKDNNTFTKPRRIKTKNIRLKNTKTEWHNNIEINFPEMVSEGELVTAEIKSSPAFKGTTYRWFIDQKINVML